MRYLYTLLMKIIWPVLLGLGVRNQKLKQFTEGRKQTLDILQKKLDPSAPKVWFHAASLGEFEQGLPVMEAWKLKYPEHQLVVTFFSPSGYEIRKKHPIASAVVYLPWDVPNEVKAFLKLVQPTHAFLIKYEFWPNLLYSLQKKKVPTFLISGIFRPNQIFFKPYGFWMRKYLEVFTHFFVQNDMSEKLLRQIGLKNITISGDTRFDRVAKIFHQNESISFVETFKNNQPLLVVGSSWEADEKLWVQFLQEAETPFKVIIAPHNLKIENIENLKSSITQKTILYSQIENANLAEAKVLIIDAIGFLAKVYKYADVVYVGGGFGNPGVHNVLEPAVFGVPVLVGPNYSHFPEASDLVELGGIKSIETVKDLKQWMQQWEEEKERQKTGKICYDFVHQQIGATDKIMNVLESIK
jgi:3-deoxy-D-manno-octulosonic-acid transferase